MNQLTSGFLKPAWLKISAAVRLEFPIGSLAFVGSGILPRLGSLAAALPCESSANERDRALDRLLFKTRTFFSGSHVGEKTLHLFVVTLDFK